MTPRIRAFARVGVVPLALAVAGPSCAWASDLRAALQGALASDPNLASVAASRDAALQGVPLARSRLLPQVTLRSTQQAQNQETTNRLGTRQYSGPSMDTQLQARQALYRPRDLEGLSVAELQAQYAELRVGATRSEVWGRVATAWVDLLNAQTVRDAQQRLVEVLEFAVEIERRRFQAGEGTKDLVVEVQAQLGQAQAQLAEAQLDIQTRLGVLNLLTGLSWPGFQGHRMPVPADAQALPGSEQALLDAVLAENFELQAARAAEAISQRRAAQADMDHRPTLDLIASASLSDSEQSSTLGSRTRGSSIGVQLNVPIYSGGAIVATQRQAAATVAVSVAEREVVAQRLRIQVASDWRVQSALHERIRGAAGLVSAAREQRRAVGLGIRAGLKTYADLSQVDQLLTRRLIEQANLQASLWKVQARLLALLPVTDSALEQWVSALEARSKL